MTIRDLRAAAGMSQRVFAEYFGIPRRTVENWESIEGSCASYIVDLIAYKLTHENLIHKEEQG